MARFADETTAAQSRICFEDAPHRVPAMRLLFWISITLVVYTYFGYPMLLWVYARLHKEPVLRTAIDARVSIIIAARNEAHNLPAKLNNLRRLDYPLERLQIVIASDGSTDETPGILLSHAPFVLPVILPAANGKAGALNEAVKQATGEILVFLDVRQTIEPSAISQLVACFASPTVGAVSGELLLETSSETTSSDALGIYWKIEKLVRKLESASGSVVGVTGAIYAIRRELYKPLPVGTILDDVLVPMQVARMGKRVIFQPSALARDRLFVEKGKEFSRKVRTLTGNYQLLRLAPWLLAPTNPLLFRFISHKMMRLFVPLFLLAMLVLSAMLPGPLYRTLFLLQVLFYVLAAFGSFSPATKKFKPVSIAHTFVLLNAAAALAFYNFVAGRNKVWA